MCIVQADDTVAISTVNDLKEFFEKCVYDEYSKNKKFVLQNDIDLNGVEIKSAEVFCGTFEGGGHSIKNVKLSFEGSNKGLFCSVTKEGQIRDLNITGDIKVTVGTDTESVFRQKATSILSKTDINTQNPPLSVIIVAKDATHELQENLPFILEQDYPEFEVIVIYDRPADDCDNTLKLLEDKYPNLYHTFIPDSARYISHKKLGITMGIKASRHEWLVFTEPDCRPQSNQWLKQMARNFTPATEIVLGYSNYEKVPGWFNKKITFDTLLNSMRYLGMAVSGHPYMGTGRNMAYRKTLYYKQKGFASHLNLQRGEDDLFINETARAHNTRVEASPESLMRIAMPKYKRIWCEEKISYAATSRLFHGTARYLMGFETCSRFLFYTAIIATITISILLHQWTIAAIAVLLWLARFTMQLIVFRKTAKVFGERKFCALLPLFDFLQPAWNGVFKLQRKFRRKNEFMRK